MSSEVLSLFTSIKNRIKNFISNAAYSSQNYHENIYPITYKSNFSPKEVGNYHMKYILPNFIEDHIRSNKYANGFIKQIKNQKKYENNNSFSFNHNESITSSSSIIEDNYYAINRCNIKEENNAIIDNRENIKSNLNSEHKTNYQKLSKKVCLIGKKNPRNFFYKDKEEKFFTNKKYEKIDNKTNTDINLGKISKFSIETKNNKDKKFIEESIDKINREASYKYKGKINNKIKENNFHLNEMNLSCDNNGIRNEFNDENKIIQKKESNLLNKCFTNLRFTHPQRFSYHSANKKSKKVEKLKTNYFISFETNISIISPLIKKRKYINENIINQNNLNDKTNKSEDKNLSGDVNEKKENLIQKNTEINDFPEKKQVQKISPTFAQKKEKSLFNFNGLSNNSINIINENLKNRINYSYNKNKANKNINKNTFINKLEDSLKNVNENNRMYIDEDNSIISKNQKDNNIFLGKENYISCFVKSNDEINFSYKSKEENIVNNNENNFLFKKISNNNKLNVENLKFSFGK